AADKIYWNELVLGSCSPVAHPATGSALDFDGWTDVDLIDGCESPDRCFTPNLYKTLRGLQAGAEQLCVQFVPIADYSGAKSIPNFTPAMWYHKAGVNSGTSTV